MVWARYVSGIMDILQLSIYGVFLTGDHVCHEFFTTNYLGDFCPDFHVPINNMHQIFKNTF